MKSTNHYRLLLFVLSMLFIANVAVAQQEMMVNFVRPGETHTQGAYYADFVDVLPQFPGGESELGSFLNANRNYPRLAYEKGIEGRVICGFVVDVDGSILHATVHRGPCRSLGEEAIRLIQSMPRWEPGRIQGNKVPCYYVLAIPFRL